MTQGFPQHPLAPYAIATLVPVPFLLIGGVAGAAWVVPAFLWLTLVKLLADRLISDPTHLPIWLTARRGAQPKVVQEPTEETADVTAEAAAPTGDRLGANQSEAPAPVMPAATGWDEIDSVVSALVRDDGSDRLPDLSADDDRNGPPMRDTDIEERPARGPGLAARVGQRLHDHPARRRALPDGDRLSVLLAALHFLVLAAAVYGLSGRAGYGLVGWLVSFFAFGIWFGQVSNSNAHELIHRHDRRLRLLGVWVYISLLFGHHASAHRLVHHRFVATPDDPNSAHMGESFYAFAARAWPGAFLAGYEMESAIRARRAKRRRIPPLHPYALYLGGAFTLALLVLFTFGFGGFFAWLMLCTYAQMQLLLSDYVQHYGLRRRELGSGRSEPIAARHSWDAPQLFSSFLMLNAPRHADHHLHPARPWPDLDSDRSGRVPMLPYSLAVMGVIALIPSRWRRLMDRRVRALRQPA